jgi:hypothetical protein
VIKTTRAATALAFFSSDYAIKTCGSAASMVMVWGFERGEIVSPVGCIASKVSGLNLATPDARIVARSNAFYRQTVKVNPRCFHYRSPETMRPSFIETS